jgi:hypothetical protein
MEDTVRSELKRKKWEAIGCPECSAILEYRDIQRFADDETKGKYDTLIVQRAIQEDPTFVWVRIITALWTSLTRILTFFL